MTTKVTDKGIIYPDGTEQTTAAFGSGDAYTKAETDDKFYDKQEINNLLEASSGAIVGNYKANYPNSVARDPEAGNLYLVNAMSFTNNYDEVTTLYISKTDADGTLRDLNKVSEGNVINLESANGSGSYTVQSSSDVETHYEFVVERGSCEGTLAQDDDVKAVVEATEDTPVDAYTKAEIDALQSAQDTKIAANTAKVSNATHTGDVTGSVALTIGNKKVTGAKIADNTIKPLQISVSGNGANNQRLASAGNGSFKWVNASTGGASTTYHAVNSYSHGLNDANLQENTTNTFKTVGKIGSNHQNMPGTWRVMAVIDIPATGMGQSGAGKYHLVRVS